MTAEHYVYGIHAVSALLSNPRRTVRRLLVSEDRLDARIQTILAQALDREVPVERWSSVRMKQYFSDEVHQGIVAAALTLPHYSESDLPELLESSKKPYLILIVDGITDPRNLGACLRTADAAGVDLVLIPKDKNVFVTPVVSKVACGAAESVPVVLVTNLARSMVCLKERGIWIYGAAVEATASLYEMNFSGNLALVVGSEADGLRRLTRKHCDGLFSLPMLGQVSSLNVSVATGIALYEVMRQQGSATHE